MPGFNPNPKPEESFSAKEEREPVNDNFKPRNRLADTSKIFDGPRRVAAGKPEWRDLKVPTWKCKKCGYVGNPNKELNEEGKEVRVTHCKNERCGARRS